MFLRISKKRENHPEYAQRIRKWLPIKRLKNDIKIRAFLSFFAVNQRVEKIIAIYQRIWATSKRVILFV
jgi:hypothetical protein